MVCTRKHALTTYPQRIEYGLRVSALPLIFTLLGISTLYVVHRSPSHLPPLKDALVIMSWATVGILVLLYRGTYRRRYHRMQDFLTRYQNKGFSLPATRSVHHRWQEYLGADITGGTLLYVRLGHKGHITAVTLEGRAWKRVRRVGNTVTLYTRLPALPVIEIQASGGPHNAIQFYDAVCTIARRQYPPHEPSPGVETRLKNIRQEL